MVYMILGTGFEPMEAIAPCDILRRGGVEHIDISDDCTVCSCDRFWSHRATGGERGSQGAVIVCREVTG